MSDLGRRRFLRVLAGAAVAGCGGSGGSGSGGASSSTSCAKSADGPGLSYCLVGKKELTLSGAASLAVGEVAILALDDDSAAIVARDARGFYALSATCTHACCTVALCSDAACSSPRVTPTECAAPVRGALVAGGAAFLCPCHGSQFAGDGSVLAGPAKAPLPAVALRVVGADVVVDLSRGVATSDRVGS